MLLTADQITIAVTVYNRREYLKQAIRSALEQTVPVRVIVVEDCGPDPFLREMIIGRFGDRITYFRNQKNRGLFDNWNVCMERCTTTWISILHDDDRLHPCFVETMLGLARLAPERSLYFGRSAILSEQGQILSPDPVSWKNNWRDVNLVEFAETCFVLFPGQLFRVADAQAVGRVRPISFFTGDWDFWFRLALRGGMAQTGTEVSVVRSHYGVDRGSSRVDRNGWKWALDNVQRKRNLARLGQARGVQIPFERTKFLGQSPIPVRILLRYGRGFTRRILAYNTWLFLRSTPPHRRYAALQFMVRFFGSKTIRFLSGLWSWVQPRVGGK